jgi:hypothetical protein
MSYLTDHEKFCIGAIVVCLWLLGFIVGHAIGKTKTIDNFRNEAVLMGHAEWRPNEFGSPTFTWKKSSP